MRSRITAALAACLLTVTAGVLAQSSGFPSRPKFQAVGVGVVAPANGNITATGTITGATVNATSALQLNGVPLAAGLQGVTARKTVSQTGLSNAGTVIAVTFDAEVFDTGNYHDNVTLNTRVLLPTQTGYAQCSLNLAMNVSTTTASTWHETRVWIQLNAAGLGNGAVMARETPQQFLSVASGSFPPQPTVSMVTPVMTVTGGDYVEAYVYFSGYSASTQSVTADVPNTAQNSRFSCWAVK